MTFFSNSVCGVTSVTHSLASWSRFTTAYSLRNRLVKPRFGMRRCSGIWPPSNPRIRLWPERERWPLWPRVDVFPWPDPMPRPTRFLAWVAPLGFLIWLKFMAASLLAVLDDADQVGNLRHHAAEARVIGADHHLIQLGQAQALHHRLLAPRAPDGAAVVLNVERWRFRHQSSSTVLPRSAATCCRSRSCVSAANVALITLCGLVVPMLLVSTFGIPADSITARTALPAMIPVPAGAGFNSTRPEPYRPSTRCGIVVGSR